MYDLVLRHGRVMDGTGGPWFRADIAVVGERIAAMARNLEGAAHCQIDARGLVVAPGFVDSHNHSDVTLLVNPRAESAVRQGITSQLLGQCGFSAAPVRLDDIEAFRRDSFVFGFEGYDWTWADMAGYRQALARAQPAINVATLVGHGALRQFAMGQAARPATDKELAVMKREPDKALEQGARGLSSGLTYAPGRFSKVEELIELGAVVRRHSGIYHTHMRDQSRFLLDSIREAIRIGEEAGIPVNISHMYPVSPPYWGKLAREATDLVAGARARGVEVTFDVTIWTRGGGPFMQHLPGWAQEGGVSGLKERLADPSTRQEIARQMEKGAPDWQGWFYPVWDDFVICKSGRPKHSGWVGRTIADLAEERGLPPAEMALILLLEDDGQYWTAPTTKSQDDMNYLLGHPLGIAVVDRPAVAPYGSLGYPTNLGTYGTFPRVLGRYAREWGVFSMEVAVKKITSMPAQRMGLTDRGLLRPGLSADITIFDPETVLDRETFQASHTFPDGIEYVIVNGQLVVERGIQHDVRPGKVL